MVSRAVIVSVAEGLWKSQVRQISRRVNAGGRFCI
jgi:hypothetical protein